MSAGSLFHTVAAATAKALVPMTVNDVNDSLEIQLTKFHPLPSEVILEIHNFTFNDAQVDFYDTQFV